MYNYKAYSNLPKLKGCECCNPALTALGFSKTDRVLILHADDIGMSHASLEACRELMNFGLISSASIMVPGPWYPQVSDYCRCNSKIDIGVHLTLNSELSSCRWRPLSTRNLDSGLLDATGYFHKDRAIITQYGRLNDIQIELQQQISCALADAIDVTHIDEHMGTVAHPRFLSIYAQLALEYAIPALILRLSEVDYLMMGFNSKWSESSSRIIKELEEQGVPLLDNYYIMPLDSHEKRVETVRQLFANLPSGLTHVAIHPAIDTPELRAMTPDWRGRVADYEAFTSETVKQLIHSSGIQIISYRDLRELMRQRIV